MVKYKCTYILIKKRFIVDERAILLFQNNIKICLSMIKKNRRQTVTYVHYLTVTWLRAVNCPVFSWNKSPLSPILSNWLRMASLLAATHSTGFGGEGGRAHWLRSHAWLCKGCLCHLDVVEKQPPYVFRRMRVRVHLSLEMSALMPNTAAWFCTDFLFEV